MIKKISLILIAIFVGGCDVKELQPTNKPDLKEMLANEISHKVAVQLKREKELYPCGFGGGTVPHIRMLALSFNYYKEVDIEKARDLLVTAGSVFLKTVNENEQVRPYLKNFPFEPKNIEVYFFLKRPNGDLCDPDTLHVLSIIDGKLDYEIESSVTGRFEAIYSETYEEALAKHNEDFPDLKL